MQIQLHHFLELQTPRRSMLRAAIASGLLLTPLSAVAQTPPPISEDKLKELGFEPTRGIVTDICLPANGDEYSSLGKQAIIMLKSSSAVSTDLPVKALYLIFKDVRIPLQRIAIAEKEYDSTRSKIVQASFYLIPFQLMKVDSNLFADFSGERKAFGVMNFGPDGTAKWPAFARLDEYDDPYDADITVLAKVLKREYPRFFR